MSRVHDDFVTVDSSIAGREDMRVIVPISVGGWARLFTRWDVLAVLLILGLLVFLGGSEPHLVRAAIRSAANSRRRSTRAICPNMPRARRCACLSRWCCRCCSLSPMRLSPRRISRPNGCWSRCSIFCSRCRSSASFRSPSCSSWRWRQDACWAPNSPPFSRSLPAKPGTWRSASISRCARYRPNWKRHRAISGSVPG